MIFCFPALLKRLIFTPSRSLDPTMKGSNLGNRVGSVFETDLGPILGPSWAPKTGPKRSQIDIEIEHNFGRARNGLRNPKQAG